MVNLDKLIKGRILQPPIPIIILCLISFLIPINASAQNFFVNLGLNVHSEDQETGILSVDEKTITGAGYHLGLGIRNNYGISKKHYFGFGIDFDDINNSNYLALRALDYQYQLTPKMRIGGFFGAIKLERGGAQNGYYLGAGITFEQLIKKIDIGIELRYGSGLARDRLPNEIQPENGKPDVFLNFVSTAFSLGWRF